MRFGNSDVQVGTVYRLSNPHSATTGLFAEWNVKSSCSYESARQFSREARSQYKVRIQRWFCVCDNEPTHRLQYEVTNLSLNYKYARLKQSFSSILAQIPIENVPFELQRTEPSVTFRIITLQ